MDRRHLVALLLAGAVACGTPAAVCPPGTSADDERARMLLAVADGTRAGRELADVDAPICFGGATRGTLRTDRTVVLADWLARDAAAARLIHLRMHVADGLHDFPAPGGACERQLEAVLTAEARAMVAEIEACAQLGCDAPPFGFTDAVLALSPARRVEHVLALVRAGPETDGLAALLRDYRTRCADAS